MSYDGTASQSLWLCRWGTQTALVWARNEENALLRVRHGVFRRRASLEEVTSKPVAIHGDVLIRAATPEDIERYEEAGGVLPA